MRSRGVGSREGATQREFDLERRNDAEGESLLSDEVIAANRNLGR